jgi:hypothetical protein
MTELHQPRYEGTRWRIVFGSFTGPESVAVVELQRAVQNYLPYVIETVQSDGAGSEDRHLIVVGTAASNRLIERLVRDGFIEAPEGSQSYSIAVADSPITPGTKLIAVAGADPAGVLHGVSILCARVLPRLVRPDYPRESRERFDAIADYRESGRPAIADRGIWTWGYAIYDYRRFLDAMTRLRMNMLTIWNDELPLNIGDVVRYAHDRGIRIVLGFHWGWGWEGVDLSRAEDRKRIAATTVDTYLRRYRDLPIDGIYCQTLTEHKTTEMHGVSTASLVVWLANEIGRELFAAKPDLKIQLGLHASSIGEYYRDLAELDRRIDMVWEDAGLIPYGYRASTDPRYSTLSGVDTLDATIDYSKKLASLRPGLPFGMVPKGWTWLDWSGEFEHHGPFVLGERDPRWIAARRAERQARWEWIDAAWGDLFTHAARFYTEMLEVNPRLIVTGLVEDGMIEAGVPMSLALFAETLWDPRRPPAEILAAALSSYYRGGATG